MSETSIWGGDNPSVAWNQNSWQSNILTVELTGVSATTSLGSSKEFNETGWGRLSWNDADWGEGADETVSVTGLGLTSSLGAPTIEVKYLLEMIGSNHSMTTSVGSPQVDGEIGVPLTGVEAEFATPTMSYVGTLVGREATASVGSPTLEFAYELAGQEATTSVGSVGFVISPTVSLTGQSATSDEGLLGLAFGTSTEPVTGVAATSSLGTLGLEFGPSAITGVSATSSVGDSLVIGSVELVNLTGVSATSSVGSISPADVVGLTGVSSTSSVGSISPVEMVQGLVTDPLTSTVGILGIESYANIDTGSNTSYSNVSTGSNDTYSDVATGSNTSYSDAA